MATTERVIADDAIRVLDHGFVRLDDAMADDLSVVNAARVSFARRASEMGDGDEKLIGFLMRERHGSPFEHNSFRFHIRCPIFVAREWFRHRVGCLTGDTEITFVDVNGHSAQRKTIDDLWRMWTIGERNGHALNWLDRGAVDVLLGEGWSARATARLVRVSRRAVASRRRGANEHRAGRWRVGKMRLRVLDESTNEFVSGHICDIVDKGVQPVYRMTLADGKHLTLTENHRILTGRGWLRLRDAVGLVAEGEAAVMTRKASVVVNGVVAHRDREWLKAGRDEGKSVTEIADEAGCSYDTVRKWLSRYGLGFEPGEAMRGRVPWNKHEAGLGFAKDIPVPARGWKLTGHPVPVVAVEYVGYRQTFDLCVEGPWHNFVANGMVVHNSFNEFSMRYAKATDDFYVPAPEDVRTQVGKPGAYTFEPVDEALAEETREAMHDVYEQAYATYEQLVERGVAREVARSVLPVGAYTEFFWTVNARSLMNFVSLRNAETAQREIRRYAEAVEAFLAQRMPVTHAAFLANGRTAP